ncbi:MAG: type II toxin-antitoxin system RelE/ParE family toxin [Bacteroidia bacterium]|nr:MAG: type II toxin-antitoxin system RelE/ParE family toxin [Bacteroidia bacterium]
MIVLFDKSFLQDIRKINDVKLKSRISKIIQLIEKAESLNEIQNLSKMKGHPSAYRIRVGEYRIGLFKEKEVIKLMRILHRKDIYTYFPL